MLTEGHIFTIKTRDPQNVSDIQNISTNVVISGINVLKDQLKIGDLVFVVFGGDKPPWKTGLVGLAKISKTPFDEGYDGKKNFRLGIDIVSFLEHITRSDLLTYPDTFDIIGIAPITKGEPNQAISSVPKDKAIALLQAICELRPIVKKDVEKLLGSKFPEIEVPVKRYVETFKPFCEKVDLREEFSAWLTGIYKRKEGVPLKKASSYVNCLSYLTDPTQRPEKYDEHSTSYWYNLYHFLYNVDGPSVFSFSSRRQIEMNFKAIISAVTGEEMPNGVNSENFEKVKLWCSEPEVKKSAWIKTSFTRYFEFLEWREAQKKHEGKDDEPPPNVDRLSIALKLFAEKRSNDTPSGVWDSYDAWTKSVRSEFVSVDESLLSNSAFNYLEYIRKYTVSGFVANTSFARHSSDEKCEVLKFLKSQKDSPKSASWYIDVANRLVVGGNQVDGMTPKSLLYFMSELHPEEFAAWTEPTYEQLEFLGLHKGAAPSDLTIETYEDCKAKQQLIVAKMKELKIGKVSDDPSAPDYRTANEFLWWLGQDDNKNLIKEEVMSKAMKKPTTKKITTGNATISGLLNNQEDSLMTMLIAGLLTKPLAILAGVSGTGKSRMVRHLAYKTCLDEDLKPENESAPGNFKMIQVKPSWHDSADLLGYRSAVNEKHEYVSTDFVKFVLKAHAYPKTPFFVCLDEMNLAPVEHYFAEFLSACESIRKSDITKEWTSDPIVAASDFDKDVLNLGGDVLFESADATLDAELKKMKARIEKEGLFIPRNLFVVGTVNMDDSTGGFSRKVLDRAMTIVMNEVKLEDLQKEDKDLTFSDDNLFTATEIDKFIERKDFDKDMMSDAFRDQLEDIRQKLEKTPFALAYRFARETCLYKNALKEILDQTKVVNKSDGTVKQDGTGSPIDADRACGDIALDHMILMKLLPRLTGTTDQRKNVTDNIDVFLDKLIKDRKISKEALDEMIVRANDNGGYLSFWP